MVWREFSFKSNAELSVRTYTGVRVCNSHRVCHGKLRIAITMPYESYRRF
jgi:hypothetical protein